MANLLEEPCNVINSGVESRECLVAIPLAVLSVPAALCRLLIGPASCHLVSWLGVDVRGVGMVS